MVQANDIYQSNMVNFGVGMRGIVDILMSIPPILQNDAFP